MASPSRFLGSGEVIIIASWGLAQLAGEFSKGRTGALSLHCKGSELYGDGVVQEVFHWDALQIPKSVEHPTRLRTKFFATERLVSLTGPHALLTRMYQPLGIWTCRGLS
jgi:hypothetical protein